MSHRSASPKDSSVGACPVEDPEPSHKDPPLTLSQMLRNSRAEISKRNTEIITRFIVKHVEPLLKAQALSGLSKTVYLFIPEQDPLNYVMPQNKSIVEGFGGTKGASPYISESSTREYVKILRLFEQEYGLEFWEQPANVKELEQIIKLRLQANGEKIAGTGKNLAGLEWYTRSFQNGEMLPSGYIGVELRFGFVKSNTAFMRSRHNPKALTLWVEIA